MFCLGLEKYFSCYILLTDLFSMSDWLYFLRYWTTSFAVVCCPVCDVINFEINLSFLIEPFSTWLKTSGQKIKIFEEWKEHLTHILPMLHFCTPWKRNVFRGYRNVILGEYGLRWNKKTFFITFKELSLKQIKSN